MQARQSTVRSRRVTIAAIGTWIECSASMTAGNQIGTEPGCNLLLVGDCLSVAATMNARSAFTTPRLRVAEVDPTRGAPAAWRDRGG